MAAPCPPEPGSPLSAALGAVADFAAAHSDVAALLPELREEAAANAATLREHGVGAGDVLADYLRLLREPARTDDRALIRAAALCLEVVGQRRAAARVGVPL